LLFALITSKYDICYFALSVNGVAFYKDAILISLLKVFRVKLVYHLHNKGVSINKSNVYLILYKYVFNNSEIILLSELLYYDIQEFVKKEKTHVCFNGIEKIIDKNELINTKNNVIPEVLFLGNLIEGKGIYVLLEACAILKSRKIAFVCNFVGGEADVTVRDFKKKKKMLGLTENVHYLGKKYGNEKLYALNHADILAFPTFYDCFPLVLLEALQFSLPVVSTFEGGVPDIIINNENGFVVPQHDAIAFADKLEILIKDKVLRQQMGEAGRKKYESEFTLEKFEDRLVEIVNAVGCK
jgi:glycosyltransferase involved in cell wall biosynthesis